MDDYQYLQSIKAGILTQALPYIQHFSGKTIVIKYGGNAMEDDGLKMDVMSDIVLLSLVGIHVVLVHGGGPEISAALKQYGKESRFVNGLRYTDEETMDIVQMVLAGKVNKDLVSLIQKKGGQAVGLCGLDGSMIMADQLGEEYGLVGSITAVNPAPINSALASGTIPVISTIAEGNDGRVYNLNADTAAARIASEIGALKLIILTNVTGIMRDVDDISSLINEVKLGEIDGLKGQGIIGGGMIPKVDCCAQAVEGGVERAHIIDGRVPHSILIEMLSNEGIGTMIIK